MALALKHFILMKFADFEASIRTNIVFDISVKNVNRTPTTIQTRNTTNLNKINVHLECQTGTQLQYLKFK